MASPPVSPASSGSPPGSPPLRIAYLHADILSAPPRSVIAHACNCYGSWGGGVAALFKRRFPAAYTAYANHCRAAAADPSSLLGTCFLIHNKATDPGGDYWIACLFTALFPGTPASDGSGSVEESILKETRAAIKDLLRQLHTHEYISTLLPGDEYVPVVHMPQINAGIFNVPWPLTEAVLKSFPYRFNVYVYP
ncbi:uncharacterized protein SAPINGB_P004596 [Magnusiomyces paraingens]|uniref:ADP-ribose 1''-phosphate phosphatase n=1 Tax=Magnusiomyces paraingens TaxID=2606893 RepID=A0A5E8C0U0_9ASCO|nr:uncharacterized protein SAPINGB_P004596 [Saprochaete ingens]VVT55437.1 unnamed protein product [Saprochaete ingens]